MATKLQELISGQYNYMILCIALQYLFQEIREYRGDGKYPGSTIDTGTRLAHVRMCGHEVSSPFG